jgi:hypothetical protein
MQNAMKPKIQTDGEDDEQSDYGDTVSRHNKVYPLFEELPCNFSSFLFNFSS